MKKDPFGTFQALVAEEFGKDVICLDPKVIPMRSGFPALDEAIGIGGYPRGRIITTYGDEMVGKSLTKMVTATVCQNSPSIHGFPRGRVLWVDAEHAFSNTLASLHGMSLVAPDFMLIRPASGEQALDIILKAIWQGAELGPQKKFIKSYGEPRHLFDMIVLDSAAALVGDDEIMDKNMIASLARMLSENLKLFTHWLDASKTTLFIINQTRKNPMAFMGKADGEPTGGKAIKFYSSLTEHITRAEWITEGEDRNKIRVGTINKIFLEKNKVAPPFQAAEYQYMFRGGVSKIAALADMAILKEVFSKLGSYYLFEDQQYHGRDGIVKAMGGDYDLIARVEKAVNDMQVAAPVVPGVVSAVAPLALTDGSATASSEPLRSVARKARVAKRRKGAKKAHVVAPEPMVPPPSSSGQATEPPDPK